MKEKNLGNKNLNLEFVENTPSSYLQFFERTMGAMSRILVHPWGLLSQNFVIAARNLSKQEDRTVEFYALSREFKKGASQVKVNLTENEKEMDYVFLFHEDSEKLSLMMMEFLDMESGTLVAPITHSYYKNKSLFLISIPKSGTHLLLELVRSFGYHDGGEVFEQPTQGYWHYIEYSNSHTSANNFFVDSVRRGNFGLRNLSFMLIPALFIYRNPLDILVSEANYYHKEGKSAFYSYLENLSFDERLLRLIDDPWLLGSIRDRVLGFIPWLSMKKL